jgi:hypothetical protein
LIFKSTTAQALAESLVNKDESCVSYAMGYIEGHYDLGVDYVFNHPPENVVLKDVLLVYRFHYGHFTTEERLKPAWQGLLIAFVRQWGKYDSEAE